MTSGAVPGGVEAVGVGPGQLQALPDFGAGEIVQPDAVRAGIGEGEVGLAGAGKFAVELERMADIDHDEKGRPALLLRQRPGVLLGLAAGGEHGLVPAGRAAHRRPPAPSGGVSRTSGSAAWRSLPCLASRTKQPRLYRSMRPRAGAAVAVVEGDGALEDVGVVAVVGAGGFGAGDLSWSQSSERNSW